MIYGWVKNMPLTFGWFYAKHWLCGSRDLSSPPKWMIWCTQLTRLPNMDGQILKRLDPYHFRFEVAGRVRSAAIQSDQSVQAGNKWNLNVVVTTWMSQSVSRSGSDALAFPHQCQIESNLNNRSQVLSSIISSPVPSLCEFVQEWGTYRYCTYP